jgi:GntR family transcriptional regulator
MRALRIDPTDATPIWSQIEEGIRRLVASSALTAGVAVPSVRDLAKDLKVNPATVAKAYQRLADTGVLTVRRGEGTYVADEPPAMGRGERTKLLREGALRYSTLAASIGATERESAHELSSAWGALETHGGASAGRKERA